MAYVECELPNQRKSEVNLKFFEYLNSKEYLVTPDIVEFDKNKMAKPVFDLILVCKTMKELGIVLDFEQKKLQLIKSFCQ